MKNNTTQYVDEFKKGTRVKTNTSIPKSSESWSLLATRFQFVDFLRRNLVTGFAFCLCAFSVSCASTDRIVYSSYQKMPPSLSGAVTRTVLKANPRTRDRAFYGNYGGSGNHGGKPLDILDELFRRHDICYTEAKSIRTLKESDRWLVNELKKLDPGTLSEEAREFRLTAIKFMSSPTAGIVGKPLITALRKREPKRSYFHESNALAEFLDLSNPGFPDLDRLSGKDQ
jgi:hypothetical protein